MARVAARSLIAARVAARREWHNDEGTTLQWHPWVTAAIAPPPPPAAVGATSGAPPAEQRFVGAWRQRRVVNYDAFLAEVVGLNWATRQIALRIKPVK